MPVAVGAQPIFRYRKRLGKYSLPACRQGGKHFMSFIKYDAFYWAIHMLTTQLIKCGCGAVIIANRALSGFAINHRDDGWGNTDITRRFCASAKARQAAATSGLILHCAPFTAKSVRFFAAPNPPGSKSASNSFTLSVATSWIFRAQCGQIPPTHCVFLASLHP